MHAMPLLSLVSHYPSLQGCRERHDKFTPQPFWIGKNVLDYGYTRLRVINSTHLYFEQISDDKVSDYPLLTDELLLELLYTT